jgi:Protein of unknown function (DUF3089)
VRAPTLACAALVAAAILAGPAGSSPSGLAPSASAHARAPAVPRWRAWLCRPGLARNYCDTYLTTTLVGFGGVRRVEEPAVERDPPIDCFYVYPTVSLERRGNADLKIQEAEIDVVVAQASRFRQVCRVFAPVYRQTTSYSDEYHGDSALAYRDVLAAWKDYLAHWNHGRGVVLVGHSQGAFVLEELIRHELDGPAARRRLLVSAILPGGNVTVADGSATGGDFRHVPLCRSRTEAGCVVAYSSWDRTPPAGAAFEDAGRGEHVACVNPAAPAGGSAPITPLFPYFYPEGLITAPLVPPVETLWVGFPHLYTARCVRRGTRAWLLVTPSRRPGDGRPLMKEILDPRWGLHASDVNVELGDLVDLVRAQGRAWAARH